MGSSDSENGERRKRSKKHQRSRSRSSSYETNRSHNRNRKTKNRSRSRSKDRKRDRKRSHSRERPRQARSDSREGRSRSRSLSHSRSHRRSRSRSTGKHSNSHSRRRSRSRSHHRIRSPNGRKNRKSSRSRSREFSAHSSSGDESNRRTNKSVASLRENDPCRTVPGFADMTPKQQAEIRMKLALKAAAEADEKLKMQNLHMASVSSGLTLEEQQLRLAAIASIDGDDFLPQEFKSSKSEKAKPSNEGSVSHENAIFGRINSSSIIPKSESTASLISLDNEVLLHPKLIEPAEVKMARWLNKLETMYKEIQDG